jgi:hypothetical protein
MNTARAPQPWVQDGWQSGWQDPSSSQPSSTLIAAKPQRSRTTKAAIVRRADTSSP